MGRDQTKPRPAPWLFPGDRSARRTCSHGRYLAEAGVGAAGAVRRGPSAVALRAAREGIARPGPELSRAVRRGLGHQLLARLLL